MLRFSLCPKCLAAAASNHGGQAGIDCQRFVRDAVQGSVSVKGNILAFGSRGPCLSEGDLEDFLQTLSEAGMQSPGSYHSAVKVVIEANLPEGCGHCEELPLGASVPSRIPPRSPGIALDLHEEPPDNHDRGQGSDGDSSTHGYRIGHAQKSLSLVLKHMWCHEYLDATPPVCVIDSIILKAARKQRGGVSKVSWTRANSVRIYREYLNICKRAARGIDLAVWELFTFKGAGLPTHITVEALKRAKDDFLKYDAYAARPGTTRLEAWEGAMRDVRSSAFGHNPTWGPNADASVRSAVHSAHGDLLLRLYKDWESGESHSEGHFVRDIEYLVQQMNQRFGKYFR